MLLTDTSIVKWNSNNKKYFVDLGYEFTKMQDEFVVDIHHLRNASKSLVKVQCDYCGAIYDLAWYKYVNNHSNGSEKDACYNCKHLKALDTMEAVYGTRNFREVPGVNEKIESTNLKKYGCCNPFANEEIKRKICETNLQKYGTSRFTQTEEYLEKRRKTSLDKYGVTHWMKLDEYASMFRGENSPLWKGDSCKGRPERSTYDYRIWREEVFAKDHYTCLKCGAHNGCGKTVILNAHHIKNWIDNPMDRYKVENGITLCEDCHTRFHSIYGKRNNTVDQMESFLCQDEKVC